MTVLRSLDPGALPRSKHRPHLFQGWSSCCTLLSFGRKAGEEIWVKRGSQHTPVCAPNLDDQWELGGVLWSTPALQCGRSIRWCSKGVVRQSNLSCNSCHALPTWGGRQNLLPSDPPAAVYSFYLLENDGSTNWTAIQSDNLFPQLQSHLLSLLLRYLLKISELMVEFKIRARLFNSIGKTELCCTWRAVCLPFAPSLKFWYLLNQLILTLKLLIILSLLKGRYAFRPSPK